MALRFLGLIALLVLMGCGGNFSSPPSRTGVPRGLSAFPLTSSNFVKVLPNFLIAQKSSTNYATAFLWRSFGTDSSSLETLLKETPGAVVEIHMSNEAGRRNVRLGEGDLLSHMGVNEFNHALENHTHDVDLRIWVAEITRLTFTLPSASWILSLGLESNYTEVAAMNLLHLVAEEWPYEVVYNPSNPNDCDYMPPRVYCETHTSYSPTKRPGKCVRSMDGQDAGPRAMDLFVKKATDEEVHLFVEDARVNNCITLLWSAELQGVSNPFIPTLEREFELHDDTVEFFKKFLEIP